MAPAPIVVAVIVGAIGIACVAWPLKAVMFCRWYHRKKPKWVQDLPFADLVMRSWMPTYFRIMGMLCCLFALWLIWIASTREFSNRLLPNCEVTPHHLLTINKQTKTPCLLRYLFE
jgi:hypothetical protein